MRGLMIVLVIVALAAAGGVSFFTNRLISEVREKPESPLEATVATPPMVAVAAADIEPGATLTDKAVRWQPWPADALRAEYAVVPPNASMPEQIKADGAARFAGKVARRPIVAGQPLTDALVFARGEAGFLAGNLSPGHRAVAVPIAAASAAAGFILPGDRVDVILSQDVRRHVGEQPQGAGTGRDVAVVRYAAETVIENVRVLAVDQSMAAGEEAADVAETATLEVTPEQAEALAVARHMGSISLTLRSLEEPPMMVAADPSAEGGIVQASGVAMAVGRQAAGAWIGDVEVSPSLAAVAGFDRDGNPIAPPEPEVPEVVETPEPPKPEPWRVTVHRGREPAEVVRGRDEDSADDAAENGGEDGFDAVYRGGGGASVNVDRLNQGLSTMSRGALPPSVNRIIGGG